MATIRYTPEQAAVIVAKWNEIADEYHQLDASKAHLLFHDNSDVEIMELGYTSIEVPKAKSKWNIPVTFGVFENEVSLEDTE